MISVALDVKSVRGRTFEGHGSVFGNVDLGGDIVVKGAFRRTLEAHRKAGTMPVMFWMHDPTQVPGVWREMAEDDTGLYVKGELVDTTLGNDIRELLDKKAVRGLSIGYRATDVEWDSDGNRLLKEVDLAEVSIVSMAMNPLARVVGMKARLSYDGEYVPTPRELEQVFRNAGCSQTVSKRLVARLLDQESVGTTGAHRDGDVVETDGALVASIKDVADSLSASAVLASLRRFRTSMGHAPERN